ncbi:hypothetical protein O1611_g159 [Lasiodiplodia mahajangana]|uniref:Uncharacterized protein n=1 Tax=Lasiodiplodia mahajangana TaxID=1108764 RepID=A0ACC2K111_9PEZI|nr:hypothetical protein O1611_g159 [Lasiodiplodia mahajangana]
MENIDTPVSTGTSSVMSTPHAPARRRIFAHGNIDDVGNRYFGSDRMDDYGDDDVFATPARPSSRYQRRRPDTQRGQSLGEEEDWEGHGEGQAQEPDLTPRGPVVRLPSSSPRPSSSDVSLTSVDSIKSPSNNSGETEWPINPVKTVQELILLEKPVRYLSLHDKASQQLPRDAHRLYRQLLSVIRDGGIYPPEVKDRILASMDSPVFDHSWESRQPQAPSKLRTSVLPAVGSDIDPSLHHLMETELDELEAIEHEAEVSVDTGRAEPAWNAVVHIPLLKLALRGYNYRNLSPRPSLASYFLSATVAPTLELCTTARIAPLFTPRVHKGGSAAADTDWSASKTVDLVLGLSLNSNPQDDTSHSSTGPHAVPDATSTDTSSSTPDLQRQVNESRGLTPSAGNNPDQIPPKLNNDEVRRLSQAINAAPTSRPPSQL